ncbi:uncharacterized protein LOC107856614 isoform X2 [Capsicum annuum]|uniref:uncharacterized protein LOC107856614 isoform X2 n=1 Tax=Capsicum annuum TaxID=4072 RepID=UPI001FB142D0|nr:uncharacterized protein LOC107856614 isoform X2 [Capsicum annuum]
MLEEIRVKVMTRLAKLSEFSRTRVSNFSPMSIKVLRKNIDVSMSCTIDFNRVTSYEVMEGYKQHTVCLLKRECSYRFWMLRGYHVNMHKKYDPLDFIDPCYSKERYMSTYSHFIQPMSNMPLWPVSTNLFVAPPKIEKLPDRPKKKRTKKSGKSKKSEKLPRTGVTMTCSECHVKGHNKRCCPMKRSDGDVSTPKAASAAEALSSKKERGRPKPGLPSRRIVSTGPKQVMKSTVVSGDIEFKPSSGLKWKCKQAITARRLQ